MDKLYIVVDGSLPPGSQIAQAAHAVAEFWNTFPDAAREWKSGANIVVVLTTESTSELGSVCQSVFGKAMLAPVHEPDLDNQLTAIATMGAGELLRGLPLALSGWHGRR
jgi:hypothetical protein